MKRRRVVAYVTRVRGGQVQLLIFEDPEHPQMGLQVPAGRLEPNEELEAGLLRELVEEAGLTNVRSVTELPAFEDHYPSRYENHGFHVLLEDEPPDEWTHVVLGNGDDAGLSFYYRWLPIMPGVQLFGRLHPLLLSLA